MKKITLSLIAALLLVSILPTQVSAGSNPENTSLEAPKTTESTEATALVNRLYEIKAMDVSHMKGAEKKQLRKEVKSIKSQLKTLNGGVYLSAGAIIIILLIIILLL